MTNQQQSDAACQFRAPVIVRMHASTAEGADLPCWDRVVLLDAATGKPDCAVTELCIRVNADGVAVVETLELVDVNGQPLNSGDQLMLIEDGHIAVRAFSYPLAGFEVAG